MEVVAVFVGAQGIGSAIQDEAGVLQPVGIAAHGGAQAGIPFPVAIAVVIAQNHVGEDTVPVGNQQPDQRGAVIGYRGGQPATGYGVQAGVFTGGQSAEKFSHEIVSFHFCVRKKRNYVKRAFCDYTIFRRAFQTFLFRFGWKRKLSPFSPAFSPGRGKGNFFVLKTHILYFVYRA